MTEWRVHCDCGFDETFPTQESSGRMVVYHNALWDGKHNAIREKIDD